VVELGCDFVGIGVFLGVGGLLWDRLNIGGIFLFGEEGIDG
jgi:hypothetical protein